MHEGRATIAAVTASLAILCLLPLLAGAQTSDGGRRFDAQPPPAAREFLSRGQELTGQDRIDDAVAAFKQAIAAAPDFLQAHLEYLRVRANFQGKVDEAKAEYEALMARQPDNPVYPMALALTFRGSREMEWYRKAAELAPDWSWAHYAKAWLALGRTYTMINEKLGEKGEQMAAEFARAIEANPSSAWFYGGAIFVQTDLGRIDQAIVTAERMSRQSELRADGLAQLWRLRLAAAAPKQEEAKVQLRTELAKLSSGARDVKLLAAIRDAYVNLLKDDDRATAIEREIVRLDPGWYPERGTSRLGTSFDASGRPYALLTANRQNAIYEKTMRIAQRREPDWRKEAREYESLLILGPSPALRKWIYGLLLGVAKKGGDIGALSKYANELYALDPANTAPFATLAVAMADKGIDLPKALEYARRADDAVASFRPMERPPDLPASMFDSRFSLDKQRENHRHQQAVALDAVGWVLVRMGRAKEAETALRRSLEAQRSETCLAHLVTTLREQGRNDEADRIDADLDTARAEWVRNQLITRPASDFELVATDGRQYKLSNLKGKVVLVTTWATWCGPCVAEMPLFVKLYEKYGERGFEILAISDDAPEDRPRVLEFAKEHDLRFPVVFDTGVVAKLYDLQGYPGNIFVDRQGNVRYAKVGAFDDLRRLQMLLEELLK